MGVFVRLFNVFQNGFRGHRDTFSAPPNPPLCPRPLWFNQKRNAKAQRRKGAKNEKPPLSTSFKNPQNPSESEIFSEMRSGFVVLKSVKFSCKRLLRGFSDFSDFNTNRTNKRMSRMCQSSNIAIFLDSADKNTDFRI